MVAELTAARGLGQATAEKLVDDVTADDQADRIDVAVAVRDMESGEQSRVSVSDLVTALESRLRM
ncbi:hypothetical protein [Actinomadura rupiterrae]|uniref:hypothetical protein n=1 Tax=Actinomadura rupiterrae TaxID=559627 RepID=UPI0020A35F30|nr:hypothetical protein [Actinomadura rupiterrae]MCP2342253.1 glycyl-tRNA synthetase (class II) [Actinomadura rupiterrae]